MKKVFASESIYAADFSMFEGLPDVPYK